MFEELRNAVATLEAVARELDAGCLDGAGAAKLADVVGRGERVCAAMKALLARRVDETGAYRNSGHRTAADWLAATTGVTVGAAAGALATAQSLEELPATDAAFRAGRLSEVQARAITSTALLAPESERELVDAAGRCRIKGLRDRCARVRALSEPDDGAWARRLHESRFHRKWTAPDGAGCGEYRLAPEVAARFWSALRDHEDRIFPEARRAGRREPRDAYAADALVALAEHGPRRPPAVNVIADHAALVRGRVRAGERCEIAGVGPIPVTTARALVADSVVTAMLRDETEITTVSSPTRTIPAPLRRWLETTYPTCGAKGCDVAHGLQNDHIHDYALTHETSQANMWRLCWWHHVLKTRYGWKAVGQPGDWDLVPPNCPDPDPP